MTKVEEKAKAKGRYRAERREDLRGRVGEQGGGVTWPGRVDIVTGCNTEAVSLHRSMSSAPHLDYLRASKYEQRACVVHGHCTYNHFTSVVPIDFTFASHLVNSRRPQMASCPLA